MQIAIVGAGLAGLSAADRLVTAGHEVALFDKGRGPGGRCATRRAPIGAFDHGAPLLHGLPQDVQGRFAEILHPRDGAHLPVPSVSALPKALASGHALHLSHRVTGIVEDGNRWQLAFEAAEAVPASAEIVLFCLPAPQLPALLPADLFGQVAGVSMAPEWTLMCGYDGRTAGPDVVTLAEGHIATRQNALPGRVDGGDRWVVRAEPSWSLANVDREREDVATHLLGALQSALGVGEPAHIALHRWLYARTDVPLGQPCLWDANRRIGCAGDWCIGPDAGDAIASGRALAEAVLADI